MQFYTDPTGGTETPQKCAPVGLVAAWNGPVGETAGAARETLGGARENAVGLVQDAVGGVPSRARVAHPCRHQLRARLQHRPERPQATGKKYIMSTVLSQVSQVGYFKVDYTLICPPLLLGTASMLA